MNVNILENNPDWRWFMLFLGCLLIVTVVVWLLFKYGQVSNSAAASKQHMKLIERAGREVRGEEAGCAVSARIGVFEGSRTTKETVERGVACLGREYGIFSILLNALQVSRHAVSERTTNAQLAPHVV